MANIGKVGGGEIQKIDNSQIVDPEKDFDAIKKENDLILERIKQRREKEKREEEEAMARRKKMAEDTIDLLKKVTQARINEIDKQIEKEKDQLSQSQSQVDYLRQQALNGSTDAAQSLKAEQVAIANQQLEIERLEKKKRNLLILTTALESASQKINNGDANAFKNTGQEIADFIAKLPKFFEGSQTTIAESLGKPSLSGRDGYIVRVDGSEKVLNPEQSAMTGTMTTDEIANAALMYRTNQLASNRAFSYSSTNSDSKVVSELQQVKQAIKEIQIPEHKFNFDEQNSMAVHSVKIGQKVIKNHQKVGGLFS
jgi:hypothetical protein